MTEVLGWPVVRRERIVRALHPGTTVVRESQFRVLRVNQWASPGVSVRRRRGGRLAGQAVFYSSLNVEAARLVHHGHEEAGRRAALAARTIEEGTEFGRLKDLLQELGEEQQQAVLDGRLPPTDGISELETVLRSLAELVDDARHTADLPDTDDRFAGRVSGELGDSVLLSSEDGTRTAVPRWMVRAINREHVGDSVLLIIIRLDADQALMQAVPGIDLPTPRPPEEVVEVDSGPAFDAFGRHGRARSLRLTVSDSAVLAGDPEPLKVLVPISIEE